MPYERPDSADRRCAVLDLLVLAASGFLVLPLLASVPSGSPRLPALVGADVAQAVATSLVLATASACAGLLALALAAAARRERLVRRRAGSALVYDFVPAIVLAVPPFALTAGLYLLVRRAVDPASQATRSFLWSTRSAPSPSRTASLRRQ